MKKRSINIQGHRTSIALEPVFWERLEKIAEERSMSVPALITFIERTRIHSANKLSGPTVSLTSTLRVYVTQDLIKRLGPHL